MERTYTQTEVDVKVREARRETLKTAARLICEGCAENVESQLYGIRHQSEHLLYLEDCKAWQIRKLINALDAQEDKIERKAIK